MGTVASYRNLGNDWLGVLSQRNWMTFIKQISFASYLLTYFGSTDEIPRKSNSKLVPRVTQFRIIYMHHDSIAGIRFNPIPV